MASDPGFHARQSPGQVVQSQRNDIRALERTQMTFGRLTTAHHSRWRLFGAAEAGASLTTRRSLLTGGHPSRAGEGMRRLGERAACSMAIALVIALTSAHSAQAKTFRCEAEDVQ